MKASNFQFLNPYLEEMFFAGNDNFDMNEDIEMENSFNVQVKKDKENRRAKVDGFRNKCEFEGAAFSECCVKVAVRL